MYKFDDNEDNHFNLLREIEKKPSSTQRELAEELGFSLGKLNYCLKELKIKGKYFLYFLVITVVAVWLWYGIV